MWAESYPKGTLNWIQEELVLREPGIQFQDPDTDTWFQDQKPRSQDPDSQFQESNLNSQCQVPDQTTRFGYDPEPDPGNEDSEPMCSFLQEALSRAYL